MTLNRKGFTQVDQVLAITYVYGGCQCIKMGCHFMRTHLQGLFDVESSNSERCFPIEKRSPTPSKTILNSCKASVDRRAFRSIP